MPYLNLSSCLEDQVNYQRYQCTLNLQKKPQVSQHTQVWLTIKECTTDTWEKAQRQCNNSILQGLMDSTATMLSLT